MIFTSFSYLLFLPTLTALYFLVPHRFRWIVLLVGSYFFYMSWKPAYGLLLFGMTLLDWALARLMMREEVQSTKRKWILTIGVVSNLGILFLFKYLGFFSYALFSLAGVPGVSSLLDLALPIGVSFYTFQSLAYMIDVYRGELPAEKNLFRYATFVSFFPHLVSGPILRPANILPQIHEEKRLQLENVKIGLYLIGLGLIKKLVVADRLGAFVDQVYLEPSAYSGATLLVATYFFAFEIYCDFSGYTDIAIGSARILGYTIPDNFRQPYFSTSITEFWRRWHISLSSWLRDYLYIPLGGNRKGSARTYFNLFVTMLLGGLWHGAAWTFVVWGAIHGMYLALERLFQKKRVQERRPTFVRTCLEILITFHLVALGWIFFRAGSFADAVTILTKIAFEFGALSFTIIPYTHIGMYFAMIALLLLYDYLQMKKNIMERILLLPWYLRWGLAYSVVFFLIFFSAQVSTQFIYFQF